MNPLAERLAAVPAGPVDGLPAVQAAQCIRAWREVLNAVSAAAEVQVMAACWAIRREHADRESFGAFAARHLDGLLEPDRAWTLAETWDAARRNRGVRDLAASRPDEAVALVSGYAEAVPDGGFDEDDRELVELLAAPPRKRRARLRELREEARAARESRDPEDVRRIRELEEERDRRAASSRPATGDDPRDLVAEAEQRLTAAAEGLVARRGTLSTDARERLFLLADLAMGALERITLSLRDEEDG